MNLKPRKRPKLDIDPDNRWGAINTINVESSDPQFHLIYDHTDSVVSTLPLKERIGYVTTR